MMTLDPVPVLFAISATILDILDLTDAYMTIKEDLIFGVSAVLFC